MWLRLFRHCLPPYPTSTPSTATMSAMSPSQTVTAPGTSTLLPGGTVSHNNLDTRGRSPLTYAAFSSSSTSNWTQKTPLPSPSRARISTLRCYLHHARAELPRAPGAHRTWVPGLHPAALSTGPRPRTRLPGLAQLRALLTAQVCKGAPLLRGGSRPSRLRCEAGCATGTRRAPGAWLSNSLCR